jgi:adenylate cyclase
VPVHPVERKLAAIFAADIAGYSRLMARNEVGTLARLKACRVIIDELIASHRGRIFNTAGDSVVADFASVVDAVQCAVAVQAAITSESDKHPANESMQFRIGVHVGDVMVDGENLLGDGVNIAARLEALAEPGAICVSATARDHIGNKLPVAFDDLGEQQVKNIAQAIRVYRVHPDPTARQPMAASSQPTLASANKPSLVVLPFTHAGSDPEQEFFADGITEDIITALSRYPWIFSMSRSSSFAFKGKVVEVGQVGRELGVRYALEGSVRCGAGKIRVTAKLTETETGSHLWAEHYDRRFTDIFSMQDEITNAVSRAIAPAVDDAEMRRAMRTPTSDLDVWTSYRRGMWHWRKYSPTDNALALRFFEQVTHLDPSFTGGYKGLVWARIQAATMFHLLSLEDARNLAEADARQALVLDPEDAEAHVALALTLWLGGDHEGALEEAKCAVDKNPNMGGAHGMLGQTLVFSGQPREALISLQTAIRVDPSDALVASRLVNMAAGHYFCGEYESALDAAKRAVRSNPDYPATYRWLAAILGQLGRIGEAAEALRQASATTSFDVYVRDGVPWMRPEDHAHMVEGLRKAGWNG